MRISTAATLLLAAMWLLAVARESSSTATSMLCGFGAGTAAYWAVRLIAARGGRGEDR